MSRIRLFAALVSVAALAACEKNAVQDITKPIAGGAFIRFHNYGVNVPGVNFYANDQKLTAISNAACTPSTDPRCIAAGIEATTGVAYGSSANGANYSMVAPGTYSLTSRIAATVDNGLSVATTSATLVDGKYYSYILSGIYNATSKTSDSFLIEDVFPTTFDYSKAYIRIVNASVNAPAISVTSKLQSSTAVVPIGASVPYKAASPFITIEPGLTDVTISAVGQPSVTLTGFNLIGGHVFTLVLRGDATSTTATGLTITGTANR
jgi:hypothetical protein